MRSSLGALRSAAAGLGRGGCRFSSSVSTTSASLQEAGQDPLPLLQDAGRALSATQQAPFVLGSGVNPRDTQSATQRRPRPQPHPAPSSARSRHSDHGAAGEPSARSLPGTAPARATSAASPASVASLSSSRAHQPSGYQRGPGVTSSSSHASSRGSDGSGDNSSSRMSSPLPGKGWGSGGAPSRPPRAPTPASFSPANQARATKLAQSAVALGDEALLNLVQMEKVVCVFLEPAELLRVIKLAAPFNDVDGTRIPWVLSLYRFVESCVQRADWNREDNVAALAHLAAWLAEDAAPQRRIVVKHLLGSVLPPAIQRCHTLGVLTAPAVAKMAWAYGHALVSPHSPAWRVFASFTLEHLPHMETADISRVLWAVAEGQFVGTAQGAAVAAADGGAEPPGEDTDAPPPSSAASPVPPGHAPPQDTPSLLPTAPTPRDALFATAAAHLAGTLDTRGPNAVTLATLAASYAIGGLPSPVLMAAVSGRITAQMMAHLQLTQSFKALVLGGAEEPAAGPHPSSFNGSGGGSEGAQGGGGAGWWMRDTLSFSSFSSPARRDAGRRVQGGGGGEDSARAGPWGGDFSHSGGLSGYPPPPPDDEGPPLSMVHVTGASPRTAAAAVASARQQQLESLRQAESSALGSQQLRLAAGRADAATRALLSSQRAPPISDALVSAAPDAGGATTAAPVEPAPHASSSPHAPVPRVDNATARAFVTVAWAMVQQRAWDGAFFAVFRRLYPRMATQATRSQRDVARLVTINLGLRLLSPFPHLQLGEFALDEEGVEAAGGDSRQWHGVELSPPGLFDGAPAAAALHDAGDGGDGENSAAAIARHRAAACAGGGGGRLLLVGEGEPPAHMCAGGAAGAPPTRGVAFRGPQDSAHLKAGVALRDPIGRRVLLELTSPSKVASYLHAAIQAALPAFEGRMLATAAAFRAPAPADLSCFAPFVTSDAIRFDLAFPALRAGVLVVYPKFMAPTRDAVAPQMLTYAALAGGLGWDVHLLPTPLLMGARLDPRVTDRVVEQLLEDVHASYWAAQTQHKPAAV